MKRNLLFSLLALLTACNSNPPASSTDSLAKPAADSVMSSMPAIQSPYEISYTSKFAIDAPKNAETLLGLWKDWDNGTLAAHKDWWADSVEMHFSDGNMMRAPKDTVLAMGQQIRNSYASSKSRVIAVTAMKSVDQNDHWVLIWGTETNTDKKGKVDSSYLFETWKFNNDGKVTTLYQYRASPYPPKKKM